MYLVIVGPSILHDRLQNFGIYGIWNPTTHEITIEVLSAVELIRIGEILSMLAFE